MHTYNYAYLYWVRVSRGEKLARGNVSVLISAVKIFVAKRRKNIVQENLLFLSLLKFVCSTC